VAFARWWLADDQRARWNVQTLIETRQRDDKEAMDAVFKVRHPGRGSPIPVFFILCQHQADKKFPHYQLQVPHGSLGIGFRNDELQEKVESLKARCDATVQRYRHESLKSIALDQSLLPSTRESIQGSISELVLGLRNLGWAGSAEPDAAAGRPRE
jgi:hypothetical protein